MQDQEFPSHPSLSQSEAAFEAVMSLLAACGHLHTMLDVTTKPSHAAREEPREDVNASINLWIDRAHKLAQVLGFGDVPESTDLGDWIDNLPPADAPRYLLPSGERTGDLQKALNEWYSAAPDEIRLAAEDRVRKKAEEAYGDSRTSPSE